MPELPGEYKDRRFEERVADIQLQLQRLRQGQEQTNVAFALSALMVALFSLFTGTRT